MKEGSESTALQVPSRLSSVYTLSVSRRSLCRITAIATRLGRHRHISATVRVTYSGPDQQRLTGLGFRDGDRTFKFRCLFPTPGTWNWKTECSDADDSGLHNQSGTVEVQAYSGPNLLYQHGCLRVSTNRRYLEHADGTPFLWIGDTAWSAPMNARMDNWKACQ